MVLGAVPEQVDGITFSAVALRVLAGTGVRVASVNEPWMLGCVVLPNGVTTGERMATRMLH